MEALNNEMDKVLSDLKHIVENYKSCKNLGNIIVIKNHYDIFRKDIF